MLVPYQRLPIVKVRRFVLEERIGLLKPISVIQAQVAQTKALPHTLRHGREPFRYRSPA